MTKVELAGYVYILASRKHGTLYVGVTNDLVRRVHEHRTGDVPGLTKRHGISKLVYFEQLDTMPLAISREKQIKKWNRDWKIRLIEERNPEWGDLYVGLAS